MNYVSPQGEPTDDAPSYGEALVLLNKLERQVKGCWLHIARLEADREEAALNDPTRPAVELLHACWKRACNRRRELDANDREQMGRAVKRLGFANCLAAIAGACYDANSRQLRNGRTEVYNDLELIFRNAGKVHDFARRAPTNWTPDPKRIAEIGGVPEDFVIALLGSTATNRKRT